MGLLPPKLKSSVLSVLSANEAMIPSTISETYVKSLILFPKFDSFNVSIERKKEGQNTLCERVRIFKVGP